MRHNTIVGDIDDHGFPAQNGRTRKKRSYAAL